MRFQSRGRPDFGSDVLPSQKDKTEVNAASKAGVNGTNLVSGGDSSPASANEMNV